MEHFLPILAVTVLSGVLAATLQNRLPSEEGRIVLASWLVHLLSTAVNLALVLGYYGRGDMLAFHGDGVELAFLIRQDPTGVIPEVFNIILQRDWVLNVSLRGSRGTGTMAGLAALACVPLADSLYAVSLLFCMASFLGKYALHVVLREFFPARFRVGVALAVMLTPSVVFWSAGIIKESVVLTTMGMTALGLSLVAKRRMFAGLPLLVVGLSLLALVKAYVVMVGAVALGIHLYWDRSVRKGRVELKPGFLVLGVVLAVAGALAVGSVFPRFSVTNLADEAQELQDRGHAGGSKFSLGLQPTSLPNQILIAPLAIVTGMFRPALFDVRNTQMLANALESTAMMLLLGRAVWRLRWRGMVAVAIRHPILVFCGAFSIGMALGVGMSTGNLGTLSRYRMPLLPFLSILVVVLYLTTNAAAKARSAAPKVSPAVVIPPYRRNQPQPLPGIR